MRTHPRFSLLPDAGLLFLRTAVGLMMLLGHGLGKLGQVGATEIAFPDPIGIGPAAGFYLAVFAEVVCAALIVVGLWTRLAALPLVATMSVAAFGVHLLDPWARMELPLLYAAAFLTLAFTGPGRWSLDGLLALRRSARRASPADARGPQATQAVATAGD